MKWTPFCFGVETSIGGSTPSTRRARLLWTPPIQPQQRVSTSNNQHYRTHDSYQSPSTPRFPSNFNHPKTPSFYLSPKIYKTGCPARPIVSAFSCTVSHISAFVDAILQPLVRNLTNYIKHTTHVHLRLHPYTPDSDTFFFITSLAFLLPLKSIYYLPTFLLSP